MATIRSAEVITCDFGWRTVSYLRVEDSGGAVGWSEFTESFGNPGLATVVSALAEGLLGCASNRPRSIVLALESEAAPSPGGMGTQARAAIENALIELHARSLEVPVSELLGGALRNDIPVYWSHCGTYRRGRQASMIGVDPYASYDDLTHHGSEVVAAGFNMLKTNAISFDEALLRERPRPWIRKPGAGGIAWDSRLIGAAEQTVRAFRAGVGPDFGIIFDANFAFNAFGLRQLVERVHDVDLTWLEFDGLDHQSGRWLRRSTTVPLASGESVLGIADSARLIEAGSVDVLIVDALWNGVRSSLSIAERAATASLSIAPHNFYGHLSTAISAHFAAAIPNLATLEVDIDGVPWRDDVVDAVPEIVGGVLRLPEGPGWGIAVNEKEVRRRSVARRGLQATHITG